MADKIDITRKWNWPIWVGFFVALGGLFSYEFFVRFPITRDFHGQIYCSLELALCC